MKRFRFLAMLFGTVAISFAAFAVAADRGIVPVAIMDKTGKQVALYKGSHALVIGASEYVAGWPKLPGVAEDVREVSAVLEAHGFNVVQVLNPDREAMEKAFNDFIRKYGHGKEDRLLFYFAGHGHTLKASYGSDMGYIIPVDAPDPSQDETAFRERAMDMQMIEVYARRIQSKHVVFVFDSCFSGSLFAMSRAIPEAIVLKTSRPVRQFITAGTSGQTVPDKSIFRGQFVRALQGDGDLNKDGYITASELGQFLEDTVTNYSKRSQTPQYGKIRDPNLDQGDFVFSLQRAKTLPDVLTERKKIGEERTKLAEEIKTIEEQKELKEEMKKLAEEKKKLEQEKLMAASLIMRTDEASGVMVRIVGDEFVAGLNPEVGYAECQKYFKRCNRDSYLDEKLHKVVVRTFSMDKYEVTQSDFERVMGGNPSKFKGANLPVERVTWREADSYCKKVGKRLPTEWEWEYAAKGGRNTVYPWGDEVESGKANFCDRNCDKDWKASRFDDGYKYTSPVGSYPPNGYGLFDMAGNVAEWTASDYGDGGKYKVVRGGSWLNFSVSTRTANRDYYEPNIRASHYGFRCAQ